MSHKLCVGLTGRMGSGKGEAAVILEEYEYKYISLSDIVREEVARSGREVTRFQMQDIGNRLRKSGGAGVLGKRVREKIEASDQDKWVIDGIRNPAEVIELRKIDSFYLVGIDSDINVIIARLKSRKRDTDNAEDSELRKRLNREWGIGETEDGQQVGRCMEMANFTVYNNESLEDLKAEILRILNITGEKNGR